MGTDWHEFCSVDTHPDTPVKWLRRSAGGRVAENPVGDRAHVEASAARRTFKDEGNGVTRIREMAVSRLYHPTQAAKTTTASNDASPDAAWANAGDSATKACPSCAFAKRRDGQLPSAGGYWVSRVLAALVLLCLALAAWVWLEILVMGR